MHSSLRAKNQLPAVDLMDLLMDFGLNAVLTPRVEQVTREPEAQARLRERID